MQMRLFVYLCVQVSIPAICMLIPILGLVYIFVVKRNMNQGLGNTALALLGSHGAVAAIALIVYKKQVLNFAISYSIIHKLLTITEVLIASSSASI
ncbi:hypothetical protein GCK32_008462 [Trichostrongylus colubriformis]|uniref:Uncharacterized protein n=1 Tax=Trichostrongylus colubriformis TaxID=6319 RepID=A0AAN8FJ75_TRICO